MTSDLSSAALSGAVVSGWQQDPGSPYIVRGLAAEPDEEIPREVADRLLAGTADHRDILGLIDTGEVGRHWYTHGPGHADSLAEAQGYACEEENLQRWYGYAGPEDARIGGAVGVALVGDRPEGWNPDDGGDHGLEGNSYLPEGSRIRLCDLHYSPDGGASWYQAPVPPGIVVHTDGPSAP